MSVGRDHDGRDLRVGDPVSLRYGGIANRGRVGANSRGEVTGFGRVNVQVHISDSSSDDLIGTTVAVPGLTSNTATSGLCGHLIGWPISARTAGRMPFLR